VRYSCLRRDLEIGRVLENRYTIFLRESAKRSFVASPCLRGKEEYTYSLLASNNVLHVFNSELLSLRKGTSSGLLHLHFHFTPNTNSFTMTMATQTSVYRHLLLPFFVCGKIIVLKYQVFDSFLFSTKSPHPTLLIQLQH
jgi:hypothetical protein